MSGVRVFLPLTTDQVNDLATHGRLAARPPVAFAVTRRLRGQQPGEDDEALEYAALLAAAAWADGIRGSKKLRRVIAAGDLPAALVTEAGVTAARGAAEVSIAEPVTLRQLVSFHVDEDPRRGADLMWYDVTEVTAVLDLLSS
ncbi:MAG: hypothetical protein IPM08_04755 [Actinomycetales bacterium]|nr:hypothetical protein [Actinomycetales bacterium]